MVVEIKINLLINNNLKKQNNFTEITVKRGRITLDLMASQGLSEEVTLRLKPKWQEWASQGKFWGREKAEFQVWKQDWSVRRMEIRPVGKTEAHDVVGEDQMRQLGRGLGLWGTWAFFSQPLEYLKHESGMIYFTL